MGPRWGSGAKPWWGFGRWRPQMLKLFADIVDKFWLQNWSKFENLAQFTPDSWPVCFAVGLSYILGAYPPDPMPDATFQQFQQFTIWLLFSAVSLHTSNYDIVVLLVMVTFSKYHVNFLTVLSRYLLSYHLFDLLYSFFSHCLLYYPLCQQTGNQGIVFGHVDSRVFTITEQASQWAQLVWECLFMPTVFDT